MGEQHGFSVERTRQVLHKGRRISSAWVREALAENNLGLAEALLEDDRIACEGTSIVECSWLEPWAFRLRM